MSNVSIEQMQAELDFRSFQYELLQLLEAGEITADQYRTYSDDL